MLNRNKSHDEFGILDPKGEEEDDEVFLHMFFNERHVSILHCHITTVLTSFFRI